MAAGKGMYMGPYDGIRFLRSICRFVFFANAAFLLIHALHDDGVLS